MNAVDRRLVAACLFATTCLLPRLAAAHQPPAVATAQQAPAIPTAKAERERPESERESLIDAVVRLPLAAALGAALAMRPRRAGTPQRKLVVVQTQVVLAVIGALVMVVVGASLARAFGVVGIAGLIRYRAKIEDPKDASVMLAALGVGLGAGVGLVWVSGFATLFLLALLWVLESKEPEASVPFALKVSAQDAGKLRRAVEGMLRRHGLEYELRSLGTGELTYAVGVPLEKRIDAISQSIASLRGDDTITVEWEEKKAKP
jgi:cytochrome c biogenesis protein CcdA